MRLEVEKVRSCLPQRYPFLLVDRVLQVVPGERVRAIKAITLSEYAYRNMGESDSLQDYAYPASLMTESLSQAAGILLQGIWPHLCNNHRMVVFGGFSGISIDGTAYPGDVLSLEARLERVLDEVALIAGSIHVDGRRVLVAERITAAIRPVTVLERH